MDVLKNPNPKLSRRVHKWTRLEDFTPHLPPSLWLGSRRTVQFLDSSSVGGYVTIDDVGAMPTCKKAVEDYRSTHGITAEIEEIDLTGVYWKKEK
jgi:hypothetical protein